MGEKKVSVAELFAGVGGFRLGLAPNGNTDNFVLDLSANIMTIDVTVYPFGVYGLILVIDGQMIDQQGLIIE